MFYTYILKSIDGKLYTGYSSNLKDRLQNHKSKGVHTTKRMKDVKLVFYEAFISKQDALRREKYLKTTKGKRTLKLMLKNSLL